MSVKITYWTETECLLVYINSLLSPKSWNLFRCKKFEVDLNHNIEDVWKSRWKTVVQNLLLWNLFWADFIHFDWYRLVWSWQYDQSFQSEGGWEPLWSGIRDSSLSDQQSFNKFFITCFPFFPSSVCCVFSHLSHISVSWDYILL